MLVGCAAGEFAKNSSETRTGLEWFAATSSSSSLLSSCAMEGALCNGGSFGVVLVEGRSSVELGFGNLTLQGWKRGMPNLVAHKRSKVAQAEASGGGRLGFKDVYRRRDSADTYRSSERLLQTSRVGTETFREIRDRSDTGVVELAAHVDTITSVGNAYVKHLVKVRQNTSYRNAAGCVVVVGSVPLREICDLLTRESPGLVKPLKMLLVLEGTSPQSDLRSCAERIVYVSEPVFRKVAGVDSTQGLQGVGVLSLPTSFCNLGVYEDTAVHWISSPRRVLVLDGIQDPGNLGTLLRTAAAFAWDGVFMLPGGCDPFNEKALRASRGASFRVPIATGRWSQLQSFADMHKMKLYAADPDQRPNTGPESVRTEPEHMSHVASPGTEATDSLGLEPECSKPTDVVSNQSGSIATAAGKEALCLILGSEGQGLSENAHRSCERVSIPMPGSFESLNVAIAGGILLYLLNNKIPVPKVSV